MNFLGQMLSEKTLNEIKAKLGEDLIKQVDEKLGDFSINLGEEKLIPKAVFDTDKDKLKKQLEERDKQLSELKKSANEELTAKISDLEKVNKANKDAYEKALLETRQNYALSNAISNSKPKNSKALEALLDKGKITFEEDANGNFTIKGLDEQVEALKKSDAYLFEGATTSPMPQNPPAPQPSGNAALRSAFGLKTETK